MMEQNDYRKHKDLDSINYHGFDGRKDINLNYWQMFGLKSPIGNMIFILFLETKTSAKMCMLTLC